MGLKHRSEFIQSREVTVDNSVHHNFTVYVIEYKMICFLKSNLCNEVMD